MIIAKYKFNNTLEANLLPVFNNEFTSDLYTVTDEVDGEVTTRTIESDSSPTLMRFGTTHEGVGGEGKSSLLEIIKLDTSNLTSMYCMFRDCAYVTSINTDGWNTSKITDMTSIFNGCGRLISLDLSNLDTSSVIYFKKMFIGCTALTSIDTSIWKTNKVIDTLDMFRDCAQLKLLDISNYDLTNVTLSSGMFAGTNNLTDIGMLYCDKDTINKVASLMSTDGLVRTIWVSDTTGVRPLEGVRFRKYIGGTRKIPLTSPLLEGDTLEVIDNKVFHRHVKASITLNGSDTENWYVSDATGGDSQSFRIKPVDNIQGSAIASSVISNNFKSSTFSNVYYGFVKGICINQDKNMYLAIDSSIKTVDSLKSWLREHPTEVIYPLETPYYEEVLDDASLVFDTELQVSVEHDSSVPVKKTNFLSYRQEIKELKPNTTYRVSFTSDTLGAVLTVSLAGMYKTIDSLEDNSVLITTGGTLIDSFLTIEGSGYVHIDNVRVTEGEWVEPYFAGLQSSFEGNVDEQGYYKVQVMNVHAPKEFGKGGQIK